jgi:hypothetical protein
VLEKAQFVNPSLGSLFGLWQRNLHGVHEVGDEVANLFRRQGLKEAFGHHGDGGDFLLGDLGAVVGLGVGEGAQGDGAFVLARDDAGERLSW